MWLALINLLNARAAYFQARAKIPPKIEKYDTSLWTKWLAIGTWVVAIFGGAAAIAFMFQLSAMREANEDNRKAFVAGNRAWIATKEAAFTKDVAGKYQFKMVFDNVGKSPALDEDIYFSIQNATPLAMQNNDAKKWIESHDPCNKSKLVTHGGVSYPGASATLTLSLSDEAGAKKTLDEYSTGGYVMLINLCATYRTFDEIHRSRVCYFSWPGKSQDTNLPRCSVGQYAN